MQIGRHLVWRIGLIKRNRLTIISVSGHKIWQLMPNLPNCQIKITAKCTAYTVYTSDLGGAY